MRKSKFTYIFILMISLLFSEEASWATTTFEYYWNLGFNQIRFREPVNFTPFEARVGYLTYGGSDYWDDLISTDLGTISPVILDSTNNSFQYLEASSSRTLAFVEFDLDKHVVMPFDIPLGWERTKGIDYGYASESACIWGSVDPTDGTLIIYRELYRKNLTGVDLAHMITHMEVQDPYSVQGVLDTSAWARTGTTGPTVGETLQRAGHKLRRADKNRIQGKIQIHEYLRVQQSGRPRLQIFNTCPNLIRELQGIPLDKNNPEDVDTHAADHAYDALRYLIMSRPRINDPYSQLRHLHLQQAYTPSDTTFGY